MSCVHRSAIAILLTAGLLGCASNKTTEKPAAKPAGMDPKQMQAMMDAWTKAGEPGKEHDFLKKAVGTWNGKVLSYEEPGKPPAQSACTETISSILGGKFTKCEVSGKMAMGGQEVPFEGLGVYGFDNAKQKYTMAWADNMGTVIMDGTGVLSSDKKTLTWTMNYVDAYTHKPGTMKEVEHFISDNETHMEMWGDMGTGQETKMIEITFTRAK